jgi:F-type H+-transporting ATPase subunit b
MSTILSALLGGGSIIDFDGTLLVQLGIFFVVFLVLKLWLFDPLLKLFDAREEAIEGARRDAKSVQGDAKEKEAEYHGRMRDMRAEANRERERLRAEGFKLEATIVSKVKSETTKQIEDAQSKLDHEAAQVRAELKNTVSVLAREIAGKLLSREV